MIFRIPYQIFHFYLIKNRNKMMKILNKLKLIMIQIVNQKKMKLFKHQ